MKKFVAASALLLFMGFSGSARAQTPPSSFGAPALSPRTALARLLAAPAISPEWLAPSFTAQIPATRLETYIQQYKSQLGTFVRVAGAGRNGEYLAIFTGGTLPALIALDEQGRVTELLFRVPQPYSVDSALDTLRNLPGSVSYYVAVNGKTSASYGQEKPLSVGTSFELSVLAALDADITKGRRRWNDVVALQPSWKSLPPGTLQDWPVGSALTLDTLAAMMISADDDTAADSLIHVLGRSAVAAFVPGNEPLLTTRDAFVLKARANAALLDSWRGGSAAQRHALVAELDRAPLPPADDIDTSPGNADVGWQYTNRQLCDAMAKVEHLPLTHIDPGPADPAQWERIAYKGSADAGTASMTAWLVAKDGAAYCVSATWNSSGSSVDGDTFGVDVGTLIESLRAKSAP